ncbi:MAG TPA: hypothetical protein VJ810_36295 [Blastocatellia bacterium]|nr:hypothetical protein [Blastocatellia bacterium]
MGKGRGITEKTEITEQTESSQERSRLFRNFRLFRSLSAAPPPHTTIRRRRWTRRALMTLGLSLAVCVALFFALPTLLIAPANATKSDVILHGAISPHSKADEYVADLYRMGIARKIVCVSSQVSWELYPGDYAREHLISLGVPSEDVISMRQPTVPCGAVNRPRVVEFVKANGWRSALIITHPEDSRYADRLNRRFFEREGIAVSVSYAPKDREELTQDWWRTHWKTQRMVGEVMSVTLDLFYSECR